MPTQGLSNLKGQFKRPWPTANMKISHENYINQPYFFHKTKAQSFCFVLFKYIG